jgi:hypothetical protein
MIGIATKFRPDPQRFETAARAGFRRAELWADAEVLLGWKHVAAMADEFGLDHAIHFPNRLDQPPEVLQATADLYRAVRSRALVLHQPHMDRHGAELLRLCPEMRLAVENHNLDHTGLERWAERSPGLALDIEHLWMYTLDGRPLGEVLAFLRAFLRRHGHKVRHVHLPGYWPGQGEHRPMYCSRDLVFASFDMLDELNFEGLIVSEVNTEFQNETDLRMDVLLFQRWREIVTERSQTT